VRHAGSQGRVHFLDERGPWQLSAGTGWIPAASPVSNSPLLSNIEGKKVKITRRIELYKGKPEIRINAASQVEIE